MADASRRRGAAGAMAVTAGPAPASVQPAPVAAGPFLRLSTGDGPPRERFERWRSLYTAVDIDVADPDDARRFTGEMRAVTGAQGVIFGMTHHSANLCAFGRNSADMLLVSLTRQGSIGLVRNERSQALAKAGDGLVLVRGDGGTRSTTRGHDHIYLSLPMELAKQAAGGDPVRNDEALRQVGPSSLAPFLIAQMEQLDRHLTGLDGVAAEAAIATATDLALALLRDQGADRHPLASMADRSLFDAACLLLEQRHGDPQLTVTSVAAALGCSRSHLYGVFARLGHTVAGRLREVRMDHARRLLRGTSLPVTAIAFRVGYDSDAAFSRAFRTQQGETPRDYRSRFVSAAL